MFRAHKWKESHVGIDHAMARSSISMAFPWCAYEIRISMATKSSSNCSVNQAAAKAADQFQTVGFRLNAAALFRILFESRACPNL